MAYFDKKYDLKKIIYIFLYDTFLEYQNNCLGVADQLEDVYASFNYPEFMKPLIAYEPQMNDDPEDTPEFNNFDEKAYFLLSRILQQYG